ncbi:MAG: DnaA/Hda family protein [Planctomycetota bacterium]
MAVSMPHDVGARIARGLESRIGTRKFALWFDRSARFEASDPPPDRHGQPSDVRVAVPSRFNAQWIERHFVDDLRSVAVSTLGRPANVRVTVEDHGFAPQASATDATAAPSDVDAVASSAAHAAPNGSAVSAAPRSVRTTRPADSTAAWLPCGPLRHRLGRFVVGPSNQLAHAAATRLAEPQGATEADQAVDHACQVVVLHGGCGLGKTHLLQGACHAALEAQPGARVVYCTGEQFTNAYIQAVRLNRLDGFRKRLRRLDVLAIDDVQFLAGKEKSQQEFLHTFDQMELGGARIILATDVHPREVPSLSEAMVSRLIHGLVVEVAAPDLATRRQLVRQLAARRGMVLTPPAVELIAESVVGSVRDLEGALTKLQALATLAQGAAGLLTEPVGQAMVRRLLDTASPGAHRAAHQARPDAVLAAACDAVGVAPAMVRSTGRTAPVVLARALTVYLLHDGTAMSYPEIARALGRKNHSGVITARHRLQRQIDADELVRTPADPQGVKVAALVERVRETLRWAVR